MRHHIIMALALLGLALGLGTGCAVNGSPFPSWWAEGFTAAQPDQAILADYDSRRFPFPALGPGEVGVSIAGVRQSRDWLVVDLAFCSTDWQAIVRAASIYESLDPEATIDFGPAPAITRPLPPVYYTRSDVAVRRMPALHRLSDGACGQRAILALPYGIIEQLVDDEWSASLVPMARLFDDPTARGADGVRVMQELLPAVEKRSGRMLTDSSAWQPLVDAILPPGLLAEIFDTFFFADVPDDAVVVFVEEVAGSHRVRVLRGAAERRRHTIAGEDAGVVAERSSIAEVTAIIRELAGQCPVVVWVADTPTVRAELEQMKVDEGLRMELLPDERAGRWHVRVRDGRVDAIERVPAEDR